MSHITDTLYGKISLKEAILEPSAPNASFCQKHIIDRGLSLVCIPLEIIFSTAEIALAAISSVGVILTGSLYKPVNKLANKCFADGAYNLVPIPYCFLLRTINPSAPFPDHCHIGIISRIFLQELFFIHKHYRDSDNLFKRHFVSRGIALTAIPITIITSVADLAIGLTAATFSIVTVGYFETINTVAVDGLASAIKITGLFGAIVSVVNPWAFQEP